MFYFIIINNNIFKNTIFIFLILILQSSLVSLTSTLNNFNKKTKPFIDIILNYYFNYNSNYTINNIKFNY